MENSKADRLGRWLSPDPLAGDVTDPQSLNRYAYVLNNPTNFSDPLGLRQAWDDPFDTGGGGGWDVGYYVDGMPVSSYQFGALMGMGAGWRRAQLCAAVSYVSR
jgi:uncharacterized protein RhaS with RHS repeats